MMTIEELLEIIDEEKIPLDSEVFVYADHAQNKEGMSGVEISRSPVDKNCPESMIWERGDDDDLEDYYSEYDLEDYDRNGKITAVTILGW